MIHLPVKPGEARVFAEARNAAVELSNMLETNVPALETEVLPNTEYSLIIDGVMLPAEARNLPFKANPGPHNVRVEAPGYGAENRQVSLTEGEVQTLTIVLTPLPNVVPPQAVAQASVSLLKPNSASIRSDVGDPAAAGRVRGVVGLGLGGAALGFGVVTGLMSASKTNQAKAHCEQDRCDASQRRTLASANTLANVANFAIPVGVLGIAYGLFELLTLPSARTEVASANSIAFDLSPHGVTLRGSL